MTRQVGSNSANPLEAFSDAVFAIIITIMVLGLHPPLGHKFADLVELRPVFLSYLLSFIYLMIYWNNHHHLLKTMHAPNGWTMWANSHLLFWLSLIPFTTAWLGESGGAKAPAALYGLSLLMAAIAYSMLQTALIRAHGHDTDFLPSLYCRGTNVDRSRPKDRERNLDLDADVLGLKEFVNAVEAAFATKATLLHSSEGCSRI